MSAGRARATGGGGISALQSECWSKGFKSKRGSRLQRTKYCVMSPSTGRRGECAPPARARGARAVSACLQRQRRSADTREARLTQRGMRTSAVALWVLRCVTCPRSGSLRCSPTPGRSAGRRTRRARRTLGLRLGCVPRGRRRSARRERQRRRPCRARREAAEARVCVLLVVVVDGQECGGPLRARAAAASAQSRPAAAAWRAVHVVRKRERAPSVHGSAETGGQIFSRHKR